MTDVFFCYRRNDNPQTAWHLAHIINNKYKTFLDTHIQGGEPWGDKLRNEITNCTVFVCLIGENWLEHNDRGLLRIMDEKDIVRQELELAFELGKKILPVLVGNAKNLTEADLPGSLQSIRSLEFVTLRFVPPQFYADAAEVARRVGELIEEQKGRLYVGSRYILRSARRIFPAASISALLSAAVTLFLAIQFSEDKPAPLPPVQPSVDAYDDIMKRSSSADGRRVVIGYRSSSPPLSYEDNGHIIGFMYETCRSLVEKVFPGFRLEPYEVFSNDGVKPHKGRIAAIIEGQADIECGSTSITASRKEEVAFLDTHIYSQTRFLSLKSLGLHDRQGRIDLKGKRISYVRGTTNSYISANYYDVSGQIPVDDIKDLFDNVRTNGVDVTFLDDVLLAGFQARFDSKRLYKISKFGPPEIEQYGIMFRRDSPKLEQALKKAWDELMGEGTLCQAYRKYFASGAIAPIMDEIFANRRLNGVSSPDDLRVQCAAQR